jgi:DNA-binding XRE family transcriptional regulator
MCQLLSLYVMGWFTAIWENLFFSLWKSCMQPVQKLIGMNIKIARTKRSIMQAEVANKMGIEASYLSRIEKGSVPVSCERIYEIIHILQCDIDEVFPVPEDVETQFNR